MSFTDSSCGNLAESTARALASLKFRNWSTDASVPVICKSFFSSTVTVLPSSVLKKLRKIIVPPTAERQRQRSGSGSER
jgi:hypothetical protein